MKGVRTATRAAWVGKVLGPGHKFTTKQAKRAFHLREFDGWYCAADPDGPAQERVVMVHHASTIVDLIRRYRSGERQFAHSEVERYLGSALPSPAGAYKLARLGFAIVRDGGGQVELRVADPRAARLVNEARVKASTKGHSVRAVVEAFCALRQPGRKRINLDRSGNRRIEAAIALEQEWGIDCADLLSSRSRVRLISRWTLAA